MAAPTLHTLLFWAMATLSVVIFTVAGLLINRYLLARRAPAPRRLH